MEGIAIFGLGLYGLEQALSSGTANQSTTFDNFNAQGGYDLLVKVHPFVNYARERIRRKREWI